MVVVYWSWNCESCPEIKYFSLFLRTALLFQLIPARGRKPDNFCIVADCTQISTYPRKGTETKAAEELPPAACDFNLSPQGDGNYRHCRLLLNFLLFQLIPARGRKQNRWNQYIRAKYISTYPRKPSQALRASSPEGRAFPAATYLVLSSPFRGSWHGVSRD